MLNILNSDLASSKALRQFLFPEAYATKQKSAYALDSSSFKAPDTPMIDKAKNGETLTMTERTEMLQEVKRLQSYRILSIDA